MPNHGTPEDRAEEIIGAGVSAERPTNKQKQDARFALEDAKREAAALARDGQYRNIERPSRAWEDPCAQA